MRIKETGKNKLVNLANSTGPSKTNRLFCKKKTCKLLAFLLVIIFCLSLPAAPFYAEELPTESPFGENAGQEPEETTVEEGPIGDRQELTNPEYGYPEEIGGPYFERQADRLSMVIPKETDAAYDDERLASLHFNPLILSSPYDALLAQFLYRPLYSDIGEGKYTLLESFEWSEDGKNLQLILKPDLFWDGLQPITTRDLYYSFSTILRTPNLLAKYPFFKNLLGFEDLPKASEDTDSLAGENSPEVPASEETDGEVAKILKSTAKMPFLSISGLEIISDYEMVLHFRENMSPAETAILRTPILPAYVWWAFMPEEWLSLDFIHLGSSFSTSSGISAENRDFLSEEELAKFFYNGAGSGPFSLNYLPNSELIELIRNPEPALVDKSVREENKLLVNKISILRTSPAEAIFLALQSEADLVFAPAVDEAEELALKEAGYSLLVVPSSKILRFCLVEHSEETTSSPLANKNILEALLLLSPNQEDLKRNTAIKTFAAPSQRNEDKTFPILSTQNIALEIRMEEALKLLAKEGYVTNYTPEEDLKALIDAGKTPQFLPPMLIYYPQEDELASAFAKTFEENLVQAGIYITFQAVSESILYNEESDLSYADALLTNQFVVLKENENQLPICSESYIFATKRLKNFDPKNPYYFLGAEDWELE